MGEETEINFDHVDYEIDDLKDLESWSSTNEEDLDPIRSKYAEFNEESDMKEPELKIGMKFSIFKQFKEAVKNYGIKNKCAMDFKPNNKKRCKAFWKRGCPWYFYGLLLCLKTNIVFKLSLGT